MNTTTVVRLASGNVSDPIQSGIPQRLFGELVKLARPVVREFESDLYIDALWVREHVLDEHSAPLEFWYTVRHSGTHIGQGEAGLRSVLGVFTDSIAYRLRLSDNDGRWDLAITNVQ